MLVPHAVLGTSVLSPDEPSEVGVHIRLHWGGAPSCVLAAGVVRRGGHFILGESRACDAFVPSEVLGRPALDVVRWDANKAYLVAPPASIAPTDDPFAPSSREILLEPACWAAVVFGAFTLEAQLAPIEHVVAQRRRSARDVGALALSAVAHVICLALAATAPSSSGPHDELSATQLVTLRRLLEASAAREDSAPGGVQARRSGLEQEPALAAAPPSPPTSIITPPILVPSPPPANSEHALPGGDADIKRYDVGGLLASLERRLSAPQPGGFVHLPDREARPWASHPEQSLQPPYPVLSDGRLDREAVRGVVRAHARNLLSCLGEGRGSAKGHVAVTVTVGSFGHVVAAHDAGGDAPVDVRECIVRGLYALTFPIPERGTATVTYPLPLAQED